MAGCIYFYHIQRILAAMSGGNYDGTVDFDFNGVVNFNDLLFALTHWCG